MNRCPYCSTKLQVLGFKQLGGLRALIGLSKLCCPNCNRTMLTKKGLSKVLAKAAIAPLKGTVLAATVTVTATASLGSVAAFEAAHKAVVQSDAVTGIDFVKNMIFQIQNGDKTNLTDYLVNFCPDIYKRNPNPDIDACMKESLSRKFKHKRGGSHQVNSKVESKIDSRL